MSWNTFHAPLPSSYREVVPALNPQTRRSSLRRLLGRRKHWWGGGCLCLPEPLLAGRHGPGRLPWGGAGRGSKKGTWAGQPASSRLCSAPEHVGWAGHGKTRSSSWGAGALGSFLNAVAMPFNCMVLMCFSSPGQVAGHPAELCFWGRVKVWAGACLAFSRGAGPTQACTGARWSQPPFLLPPGNQTGGIFHIWQ